VASQHAVQCSERPRLLRHGFPPSSNPLTSPSPECSSMSSSSSASFRPLPLITSISNCCSSLVPNAISLVSVHFRAPPPVRRAAAAASSAQATPETRRPRPPRSPTAQPAGRSETTQALTQPGRTVRSQRAGLPELPTHAPVDAQPAAAAATAEQAAQASGRSGRGRKPSGRDLRFGRGRLLLRCAAAAAGPHGATIRSPVSHTHLAPSLASRFDWQASGCSVD
jgi:hypothetical protein